MLQPDEIPKGMILSDIAKDVRAAIDQGSKVLLEAAAREEYAFPWTLTAMDSDGEVVFSRCYTEHPTLTDGVQSDEIVGSPADCVPRFPVTFRLVDRLGQDITWSIGVKGFETERPPQ